MYVRTTTVQGDPNRVDQLIALVRDEVRPAVAAEPGSLGLAAWVDRGSGTCVVATGWTDRNAVEASTVRLAGLRESAAELAGGPVALEVFEVDLVQQLQPITPGCWTRSVRLQHTPGSLDVAQDTFRESVLPRVQAMPGLCAVVLLVDRASRQTVAAFTFASRQALDDSRQPGAELRATVVARIGAEVMDVVEREVVLAELRQPGRHEHLLRAILDVFAARRPVDDLDRLIAPDVIEHRQAAPGMPSGLAGVKALAGAFRTAFPDLAFRIERYLEQGDTLCAVLHASGTQTGPLMGLPATGRTVEITEIHVLRIADDRCVEHWGVADELAMFRQLGAITLPEPRAGAERVGPTVTGAEAR